MENEYIKEIERLKSELDKYRWIPVSERLPEYEPDNLDPEIIECYSTRLGVLYGTRISTGIRPHGSFGFESTVTHWKKRTPPPSNKNPGIDSLLV